MWSSRWRHRRHGVGGGEAIERGSRSPGTLKHSTCRAHRAQMVTFSEPRGHRRRARGHDHVEAGGVRRHGGVADDRAIACHGGTGFVVAPVTPTSSSKIAANTRRTSSSDEQRE